MEKEQLILSVPVESNWNGNYRIEYDGKYVTLFGEDKNYPGLKYNNEGKTWYEEMVLIPLVCEIRNAHPFISKETDTEIFINMGVPKDHDYSI